MNRFRFRAECRADVEVLMDALPDARYELRQLVPDLSYVQVDVIIRLNLWDVKSIMAQLPDHKIMFKTIASHELYRDTFPAEGHNEFSNN